MATDDSTATNINLDGLFCIEDRTDFEDEVHRGYWLSLREPDGELMTLFSVMSREIAEHLKGRIERAILSHIKRATSDD